MDRLNARDKQLNNLSKPFIRRILYRLINGNVYYVCACVILSVPYIYSAGKKSTDS